MIDGLTLNDGKMLIDDRDKRKGNVLSIPERSAELVEVDICLFLVVGLHRDREITVYYFDDCILHDFVLLFRLSFYTVYSTI